MSVRSFLAMLGGFMFYGLLMAVAVDLFVGLLYAVLRGARWIWDHYLS